MEVTSAYLYTANTLPQILEAIQKAQVPPKFTNPFLQALGFKSTNDRAFINVRKGPGINLPATREVAVYGAISKSIREHLL